MPYTKINWQDGITPINATNLNKMDSGISEAHTSLADIVQDVTTKLDKKGGIIESYSEKKLSNTNATGTVTLDLAIQNTFDLSLKGNTTIVFSNVPASPNVCSITVFIKQDTTARSIIFPSSVKWSEDEIPDAPTANKVAVYTFVTLDGGNRWYGFQAGNEMVI